MYRSYETGELERPAAILPVGPIMQLRGLRKSYGAVRALKDADLLIRPGEIHAIVGENGAGKSTLIGIAAGVIPADAGTIRYDGENIYGPNPTRIRELGISVTFQHPALAPDLSVLENLQLAAPHLKGARATDEAGRVLFSVAAEANLVPLDRQVRDLNLAQQHIVEIARALITRPRVLFFDEPTEPFQQADVRKLFDRIKTLRLDGVAIVYVSHRLHEIDELADRISVMRDGEIIDSRPAGEITAAEVVTLIAGRPLGQLFPPKARAPGETAIEVRGLSGAGFESVDMSARAGEIVGITGVEGEGQRQFLRAAAGVERRRSGAVQVRGEPVRGTRSWAARRAGIGFVSDDRHAEGLFLSLSLRENLGIGFLDRVARLGVVDRAKESERARSVIEQLRVRTESIETPVGELSGGNQQKVLIGREMSAAPAVLMVDEPTKGVDIGARAEIYQRLRALAEQGMAIIVCCSDGIELEGLCDRVLIFARGRIVRELRGSEITDASITEANLTAKVSRAEGTGAREGGERWRRLLRSDHFPALVLAALTAIILVGTELVSSYFLTPLNIANMLIFLAIVVFAAAGQMATILVGRIDLSVGALAGFMVVLASFTMKSGTPLPAVIGGGVLVLLCGMLYGLFQGILIAELGLPAIIVTLASFIGLQGLSLALRPKAAGEIDDALSDLTEFPILGVPAGMALALVLIAVIEILLYRSALGRRMRAVGSSPLAGARLGLGGQRHLVQAFVICGLLTGIGGLLLAGEIGMGSATVGADYTIISLTAVVLGGASITGGRASALCTLMGAALIQATSSAAAFFNQNSSWHYTVLGAVTLIAATFFSVVRRTRLAE